MNGFYRKQPLLNKNVGKKHSSSFPEFPTLWTTGTFDRLELGVCPIKARETTALSSFERCLKATGHKLVKMSIPVLG